MLAPNQLTSNPTHIFNKDRWAIIRTVMAGESDGVLLLAEQDEAEGEDVITEQRGV